MELSRASNALRTRAIPCIQPSMPCTNPKRKTAAQQLRYAQALAAKRSKGAAVQAAAAAAKATATAVSPAAAKKAKAEAATEKKRRREPAGAPFNPPQPCIAAFMHSESRVVEYVPCLAHVRITAAAFSRALCHCIMGAGASGGVSLWWCHCCRGGIK